LEKLQIKFEEELSRRQRAEERLKNLKELAEKMKVIRQPLTFHSQNRNYYYFQHHYSHYYHSLSGVVYKSIET
jgi:hypothetical protein